MAITLSIAEVALALVLIVLAVLLPAFKQKSRSTWRSTWERYLPYFNLVLLALNLVWVVDDIHARKPYAMQLIIATALAVVVVYMLAYHRRHRAPKC
jgi:putative flippase GtrA